MKYLYFAVCFLGLLSSCTNDKKEIQMPAQPTTPEAAMANLKNKKFEVSEVGFIRTFMEKEEPLQWSESMNDTSDMYKHFIADRKDFTLNFINDSSVKLEEEKKNIDAFYQLEKDTSKAILLLIKYADTSFNMPGSTEPAMVTYTYKIKGIDENKIFLETPRTYNDQRVMLMMKRKE